MNRAVLVSFITAISLTLSVMAEEGLYFKHIGLKDGLSQVTVNTFEQDGKGYIWIGTRNGLNRYNGYTFDILKSQPNDSLSISDNYITALCNDSEGNLWAGTNVGLNRININSLEVRQYHKDSPRQTGLTNSHIRAMCRDYKGDLWVGTRSGLCKYDKQRDIFVEHKLDRKLRSKYFNTLAADKYGNLYIGTNADGICVYNIKNGTTKQFKSNPNDPKSLSGNAIFKLFLDDKERLWIGIRDGGVDVMNIRTGEFQRVGDRSWIMNSELRCFTQHPDNKSIYMGTTNGLFIVDPQSLQIRQHYTGSAETGGLSHYSVHSMLFDDVGSLWAGTYAGGVNYCGKFSSQFRFFAPLRDDKRPVGVMSQMVEHNKYVYIGTEGSGLMRFSPQTKEYKLFPLSKSNAENNIKSLYLEAGRIYCGTNTGQVYIFDTATEKVTLYHTVNPPRSIYAIERHNGKLLICTISEPGLFAISQNGDIEQSFPIQGGDSMHFRNICSFVTYGNDYIIGARNIGLFRYDAQRHQLSSYTYDRTKEQHNTLPSNNITTIVKGKQGIIWIGTVGGGFVRFDPMSETFTTYGIKQGLQSNEVYEIIEDTEQRLWISNSAGVSMLDLNSKGFKNYTYPQSIAVSEFNAKSGIMTSDTTILFGGNNGVTYFKPSQIRSNPIPPKVIIENLYIPTTEQTSTSSQSIVHRLRVNTQQIILKHTQRNLSIEFCALNYTQPDGNRYSYKLEGFDKSWSQPSPGRIATYTNLPSGSYIFNVRASNNDAVWNNMGAIIEIKILPSPWLSWWAYTIYISVLAAILYLIIRWRRERAALQRRIEAEHFKAAAREEFHQDRLRLFANFSHELRTPLTLISGPLDDYVNSNAMDSNFPSTMRLMHSNAQRMMRIVNNLMDFCKNESGKMTIMVDYCDIMPFCEDMLLTFSPMTRPRNISVNISHRRETLFMWYDHSLMEKVFFNLLSNAIKNTPDGGAIEIFVEQLSRSTLEREYSERCGVIAPLADEFVHIAVSDNGLPIEHSELERIFIPFYQVARTEHSQSGTGIGLSLTKAIVEMHHGVIWAQSDEQGVSFSIIFPINSSLYTQSQIVPKKNDEPNEYIVATEQQQEDMLTDSTNTQSDKYNILIIEDNADVQNYLTMSLEDEYNISCAQNGEVGLKKAQSELPDIILSDIMMPKIDGLELIRILKADIYTSHIPVVLITARTAVSQIQQGYALGADDYILKPFNMQIVRTRISNILMTREKLKTIYSRRLDIEAMGLSVSSIDEVFVQKLYGIIEQHMSKPDLSLDDLAQLIGMSKASLYRKMKAIVNLSPNEFIRNFRLETAAKLLKSGDATVSDIFVAVGFNSHAYFSNCFKKIYHLTPSEYQEQNKFKAK